MKIALVSPYDFAYPGGVNSHISHLSRELIDLGHQVKILAPSSADPDALLPDEVICLGRAVPIPSGGSIARISVSLWLIPRLRKVLEKEQFDVIHIHEPFAPFLPLSALHLSNSVNVGTFHAYRGNTKVYSAGRRILMPWFKRLDGRIAVSPPAMEFVSKHFPGEYEIIPNGIDVDRFSNNSAPIREFKDGKINLLFVGRLEKRKGLRYLLGALGQLTLDRSNLRLIVVGPGNPDRDSYRIISERNLTDKVIFTGRVSQDDLPRYYATADICCYPATGKESFGIVLLEAMASGKPIVASDIEGYASVLSNEREGFLVQRKDEEALAEGISRLIDNPSLRLRMGTQGRETAENYRWNKVAIRVEDYYYSLLAARKNSASESAVSTSQVSL